MDWSPAILGAVQGQNKKIVLALNTLLCVCEREREKPIWRAEGDKGITIIKAIVKLWGYGVGECIPGVVALQKNEDRIALVKSKLQKWMLHQWRCEKMRNQIRFSLGDCITSCKINDAK